MFTLEKTFKIPMSHRLSLHKGLCQNFHGHEFIVKVELRSPNLDKNNMVIDFSEVKRIVNLVLDNFDHSMILNKDDPMLRKFPTEYRIFSFSGDPTAEKLSEYFFDRISIELTAANVNDDIKLVSVSVWENSDSMIKYTPG
jgi:6-pyruvoyltetrahydropterin/6-carboxytetrahydropterin synthase